MKMNIRICKAMNFLFKVPPLKWLFKRPALGIRKDLESYAEWEFQNAAKTLICFKPYDNIKGKTILDSGCGLGGKSTYYALNGAKYVTAIDLDKERIEAARDFARKKNTNNIRFEIQNAASLPYAAEKFDIIIFNDSFEHIDNPANTLKECYRVLRKGGMVNIIFPPYSSPWGAHLFAHIRIPWAQFLFSEETLLSVWKEMFDGELKNVAGIYSKQQIDAINNAKTISELAHLNKMSIKQCEEILEETQFNICLYRLHTSGNLLSFFTHFSSLRECIVTRVVAMLEK